VFFFITIFSFTETFRVHKTIKIDVQDQSESIKTQLGINDALAIVFPSDTEFLKGLEFEITIPQVAAYYQGAIAWSFYDAISPAPNADVIDYSGTKLFLNTFPGSLSYNFKIPFVKDHNFESSPYTTILKQLYSTDTKLVFLRFQLAMKGTSNDLYNAIFTVQVKPILYDEGLLHLKLEYPGKTFDSETEKIKPSTSGKNKVGKSVVYVDEVPLTEIINGETIKSLRLATGIHTISIVSDNYRNELRTVTVDQAKTTELTVSMRDIKPLVVISAPSSAKVFIDEKEVILHEDALTILPGEHQIKFVIGDYELVKKIIAENGKTYSVSVSMDVIVCEKK